MKQISSRQTERDVKRRAVSLVSDAPLADVCLWQLTSQYGQLVAARGTLPGIDASLANLDNAETIAKLLFQAESKVLLPNLPSLPGIFDDLTFAMVLFEKSQRLLRESLQQQSDDGVVAQAVDDRNTIQQEEHFRKVLSRRCKDFHKEVNDCCALARALLRKMIGAVEADLGTLAERVRLAEKHEALLSAPPKEEELHTLEDLYSYARDLHEDNLEKERRLEREQRTQQRRLSGHSEVGPAGSAALEEAKAATAVSRKNVQRAEQEFHRKLIDFVRIKQAPWGLPELRLKVDDEHLDTVDVLTPGRRCSDYEELLPLAGSSSTIFTAKYNEEACVLKELRSMTQSGALRREVLHRKKLKHPLIVPVLAAFEEEDKGRFIAYVHMPRYSCNLEEWCSSESCTLPKMCQVLRDLVLVVTYVHSHHVVHGDLKPSNFLMDSDDHPCLTDFETSQCLDAQSLHSRRTTLVVGASQGYMPPEFPNLTAASDIYSLGCICDHLLQCWAQKWPQNAAEQRKALSTVVAKMQRHETDDRPPAVEVLEDMTSAMKAETVEMSLPLYWRNSAELSYDKYEVLKEDLAEWNGLTTFQQLEHALLRTVHDSCLNRIFGNTLPRISFVQRVENPKLKKLRIQDQTFVVEKRLTGSRPAVRPSKSVRGAMPQERKFSNERLRAETEDPFAKVKVALFGFFTVQA
eukprot:g3196.t1